MKYLESRKKLIKIIESSAGNFLTQKEEMKMRQMRYYRELCLSEIKSYRYYVKYAEKNPELRGKIGLYKELIRLRKKESVIVANLIEKKDFVGFVQAVSKFARESGLANTEENGRMKLS